MLKEDGQAPSTTNPAGVCNLLLYSLFEWVELQLNEKVVHTGEGCYPYKAYLETLLASSASEKSSRLQAEGWWLEELGYEDTIDLGQDPNINTAMVERSRDFVAGRIGDLAGRLQLDLFSCNILLIPGVDLQLKLYPQKTISF